MDQQLSAATKSPTDVYDDATAEWNYLRSQWYRKCWIESQFVFWIVPPIERRRYALGYASDASRYDELNDELNGYVRYARRHDGSYGRAYARYESTACNSTS